MSSKKFFSEVSKKLPEKGRDKRIEPFDDHEWDKAEKADEESEYYWLDTRVYCYKDFLIPNNKGGKFVKRYKPSIAKLVAERTGYRVCKVLKGEY